MDTWDPLRGYASPQEAFGRIKRPAQLHRHQLRLAVSRRGGAPLCRNHPRGRRPGRLPRNDQRSRPRRLSGRAGRAGAAAAVAVLLPGIRSLLRSPASYPAPPVTSVLRGPRRPSLFACQLAYWLFIILATQHWGRGIFISVAPRSTAVQVGCPFAGERVILDLHFGISQEHCMKKLVFASAMALASMSLVSTPALRAQDSGQISLPAGSVQRLPERHDADRSWPQRPLPSRVFCRPTRRARSKRLFSIS